MYALTFALALVLARTQGAAATGTTPLVKTYSGDTFFDDWTYFGTYDNTTNGDVNYVNNSVATSTPQLTYTTSSGTNIIRVDNTSTVEYNYKRDSVKILSEATYEIGSVWVLDAVHVPYGCSVWPGFWSYGAGETWPGGGEIDTFEGVNNQGVNQMALHTEDGPVSKGKAEQLGRAESDTRCDLSSATSTGFTGTVNDTSCYYQDNSNSGCGISDTAPASYGSAFAKAGGGVWITELASDGVSIWFFSRSDIPSSVSNASSSIDTSGLGTPAAFWSSSGCAIDKFFTAQKLVFDITLCGDWAGTSSVLASTGCAALTDNKTCYTTYVLDASNYDTAYFEINSLKVYSNSSSSSTSSAKDSSSTGAGVAVHVGLVTLATGLAAAFAGLVSL